MTNLSQKAMLVDLSISQCTFRKCDKQATKEVHDKHHAGDDAGRYNKALVAKEAIQAIAQAANAARTFHYDNTLPWSDKGARILPAANYLDYTRELSRLKDDFERAVGDFLANYPQYVDDARIRLNGLFRADDYPAAEKLPGKYGFTVNVLPLPSGDDFRVSLQDAEVDKIRKAIEEKLQENTTAAMKDLWQRLHHNVSAMVERLSGKDNIFRDSLVNNLCDLVALLPRLNITNDANLEKMRRDIEEKLCSKAPETLRKDTKARQETAKAAADILDVMAGYCG